MDIFKVRSELRTKSIYDIPLRVTYYARVSSESDEQLNSLDNQIAYYADLIQKNTTWTYVPGYIDEGLSGISTKKRKRFRDMIADAKAGLFDLILTKEISRFARNTLDSLQYTRDLLSDGVGVIFQNDNINTLDEDAELRLTIMSSIAQDELRKLSSRVKFGHQQAIKSQVVLGNSRIFGYRKKEKHLVIDETQAPMVKKLFSLYAGGEYSLKQLEDLFYAEGYRNYNGNKIAHSTLSGIISNPKYKGYYVGNKVRVVDMFTKKQKFLPKEEWVMFKDESGLIVPPLVSEELWEMANEVLKKRSEDVKNRQGICNHANLLTGKLYCAHCGAPYYRRDSKTKDGRVNSKWICSQKLNQGTHTCPSFPLYEDELKPILLSVFQNVSTDASVLIESFLQMVNALERDSRKNNELEEIKRKIALAEKKKNKLLELVTADAISVIEFKEMNLAIDREIEMSRRELTESERFRVDEEECKQRMKTLRETLEKAVLCAQNELIDQDFVSAFIDSIEVSIVNTDTAKLEIKLSSNQSLNEWITRQKMSAQFRTGHTFKKMVEKYENDIKNSK